jgi:hypothetical protein
MLFTMLIFIRPPNTECYEPETGKELVCFSRASWWYGLAVGLHLLLTFLHVLLILENEYNALP